jgi:N-succinyldiaminopimelate aminotransferase
MNPHLQALFPYPFQRLSELKASVAAPSHLNPIFLSIGEPKHPAPDFVKQALYASINDLARYPTTQGTPELREAIASWLTQRFRLSSVDAETHILPVAGTREALFAFTQAVINKTNGFQPLVVCPNPFYQIYEGAALLAGAEMHYLNCDAANGFIPDLTAVPEAIWQRCQLLQLCSPGNPSGAILSLNDYKLALELADKYDFVLSNDECYSEIYTDEKAPPLGLLEACQELGRDNFERCIVFHSLSKRSNLPGLRSGFVAGDQSLISAFFNYRTYHGCALSLPVQQASIAAWQDESHVIANRQLYREKFSAVSTILQPALPVAVPDGSFYLWPKTPMDDREFAKDLFAQENLTVLPGQFLSRTTEQGNPGTGRIRLALVAPIAECLEAAERLVRFVKGL